MRQWATNLAAVLLAVCALVGCNGPWGGAAPSGDLGNISVSAVWPAGATAADAGPSRVAPLIVPAGILSVQATVFAGGQTLTTIVAANAGQGGSGSITGVPVGSATLTLDAFTLANAAGTRVYTGTNNSLTVVANQTTLATVTMGLVSGQSGPPWPYWTWVSGSNTHGASGVYGSRGVTASSNIPGARNSPAVWKDASGNVWLFGGYGDNLNTAGPDYLDDLWKFDGANWTWVAGSSSTYEVAGVYGGTIPPITSASNLPGARNDAVSWTDGSGNSWLFGGYGYDGTGTFGNLNDLWKFDGTNWTWVAGSKTQGAIGVYGTLGTAASANIPGNRHDATASIDTSTGDVWLFGGNPTSAGYLNDLWKFDGTNWTWVSGSNTSNTAAGIYGTLGTPAASNVPGARYNAVSWIDGVGHFWLFGGYGYDSAGNPGNLNDLWKFDGANWTWVAGSNIHGDNGSYGTQGVPAPVNIPGARNAPTVSKDAAGMIWLFGGLGDFSSAGPGYLNDLWIFDGTNWTWVSGSNTVYGATGSFGTPGVAAAGNVPSARYGTLSWVDSSGLLWVFGGYGADSAGATGNLNDLWSFATK